MWVNGEHTRANFRTAQAYERVPTKSFTFHCCRMLRAGWNCDIRTTEPNVSATRRYCVLFTNVKSKCTATSVIVSLSRVLRSHVADANVTFTYLVCYSELWTIFKRWQNSTCFQNYSAFFLPFFFHFFHFFLFLFL